jgi:hypothetical protein
MSDVLCSAICKLRHAKRNGIMGLMRACWWDDGFGKATDGKQTEAMSATYLAQTQN